MWTAPTAPKVKLLAERPNVALTIDVIGPPAKALLVRGVANIEIVDGVAPEYLAAAPKSTSGDELAAFGAQVWALYKQMARITIAPTWARFYDFARAATISDAVQAARCSAKALLGANTRQSSHAFAPGLY